LAEPIDPLSDRPRRTYVDGVNFDHALLAIWVPSLLTAALPDETKLEKRLERAASRALERTTGAGAVPQFGPATYADQPTKEGVKRWVPLEVPRESGPPLLTWLIPPTTGGTPKATIVVLHGWGANVGDALGQTRFLLAHGYQLLLVNARSNLYVERPDDYRGFLHEDLADIDTVLAYLESRDDIDRRRLAVYGFSWGGLKALLAAAKHASLRVVVEDAGPLANGIIWQDFFEYMPPSVRNSPPWKKKYADRVAEKMRERLGYDFTAYDVLDAAAALSPRPLLVIHSMDDAFVPLDHGEKIFAAAKDPKKFLRSDRFGHCQGMHKDPDSYIPAVVSFLDSAFDAPSKE
jgi:hypothetical protein